MFGIGMSELLLILALAVIVLGPKRLPEVARALGKGLNEFRKAANDIKSTIDLEAIDEPDKSPANGIQNQPSAEDPYPKQEAGKTEKIEKTTLAG